MYAVLKMWRIEIKWNSQVSFAIRRGKNLENCWSRIKNNIFLHGQPKGVNTGTEGAIKSVLIQTGCSYLAGLQVMSHLLSEQNNKETKEDISIVKLIIFDLHKAVILRIKSTSNCETKQFIFRQVYFICVSKYKSKIKTEIFYHSAASFLLVTEQLKEILKPH